MHREELLGQVGRQPLEVFAGQADGSAAVVDGDELDVESDGVGDVSPGLISEEIPGGGADFPRAFRSAWNRAAIAVIVGLIASGHSVNSPVRAAGV